MASTLPSGARLPPERELARMLGVGRTTVREAMRVLEARELVAVRHGAGAFVRPATPPDGLPVLLSPVSLADPRALGDLFAVRGMLECGAAELAASRADIGLCDELDALIERFAAARRDPATLMDLDRAFHRRIHAASGNAVLAQILEAVLALGSSERSAIIVRPRVISLTLREHAAIVVALRRRAPQSARAAMAAHVRSIKTSLSERS